MKKHSKSLQRSGPTLKRTKARGPVQRDANEVIAEVLGKLTGKLDAPAVSTSAKENRKGNTVGPNRDRLTVSGDHSQFFAGLRGTVSVTFEEGTWSVWLYDLLNPHVDKLVVCNPRKKHGFNTGLAGQKLSCSQTRMYCQRDGSRLILKPTTSSTRTASLLHAGCET